MMEGRGTVTGPSLPTRSAQPSSADVPGPRHAARSSAPSACSRRTPRSGRAPTPSTARLGQPARTAGRRRRDLLRALGLPAVAALAGPRARRSAGAVRAAATSGSDSCASSRSTSSTAVVALALIRRQRRPRGRTLAGRRSDPHRYLRQGRAAVRADADVEPGDRGGVLLRAPAAHAARPSAAAGGWSPAAGAGRAGACSSLMQPGLAADRVPAGSRCRRPGRSTSGCRRSSAGSPSASGWRWCSRLHEHRDRVRTGSAVPSNAGCQPRAPAGRSPWGFCSSPTTPVAGPTLLVRRHPGRGGDQEPALRRGGRPARVHRASSPLPAAGYARLMSHRVAAAPGAHLLRRVLHPPAVLHLVMWIDRLRALRRPPASRSSR